MHIQFMNLHGSSDSVGWFLTMNAYGNFGGWSQYTNSLIHMINTMGTGSNRDEYQYIAPISVIFNSPETAIALDGARYDSNCICNGSQIISSMFRRDDPGIYFYFNNSYQTTVTLTMDIKIYSFNIV